MFPVAGWQGFRNSELASSCLPGPYSPDSAALSWATRYILPRSCPRFRLRAASKGWGLFRFARYGLTVVRGAPAPRPRRSRSEAGQGTPPSPLPPRTPRTLPASPISTGASLFRGGEGHSWGPFGKAFPRGRLIPTRPSCPHRGPAVCRAGKVSPSSPAFPPCFRTRARVIRSPSLRLFPVPSRGWSLLRCHLACGGGAGQGPASPRPRPRGPDRLPAVVRPPRAPFLLRRGRGRSAPRGFPAAAVPRTRRLVPLPRRALGANWCTSARAGPRLLCAFLSPPPWAGGPVRAAV